MDAIAAKHAIEKTALTRVRAGISYVLAEAMDEGHCGLPAEDQTKLSEALLSGLASLTETVPALELKAEEVVADALEGSSAAEGPLAHGINVAAATGQRPAPWTTSPPRHGAVLWLAARWNAYPDSLSRPLVGLASIPW